MALSESDVQKQILHMIAYIEQEANEKAEEIETKAEEEFLMKKDKFFQKQKRIIMQFYDKKEKQVELQRKIQLSNMINQARLKVLKVREDHIHKVIDQARKKLANVSSNKGAYSRLIVNLIVQALFQLVEPEVTVRVKKSEASLVQSLFDSAQQEYRTKTKKEVKLSLDKEIYLPADSCGGVELFAAKDRIRVDNTLEARMLLIANKLLPAIRAALFGTNPNRKFKE